MAIFNLVCSACNYNFLIKSHLSLFPVDDSDHHYESMYSGNYENQQVHHSSSHHHHGAGPAPQNLDIIPFDDEEFDSFDSDLDEDEDVKKVSGIDNCAWEFL